MQANAESTVMNPSDGKEPTAITRPLLLNPIYARAKSTVFDELRYFRICLKWCALDHSSAAGKSVSFAAFVALGLVLPAATSLSLSPTTSSPSASSSVSFHKLLQIPASALAAIAFLTLAAFFRRYGLRQLLFLDGALREDSALVRLRYSRELDRAFNRLLCILLPCFVAEIAHKVLFFSTVTTAVAAPLALAATLASWVYRAGVFLLVCVLFRLTCELQILRFEGLYKMFEDGDISGSDPEAIYKEHVRIRRQLLVTSHRYRIFIIGCLVTITVSQLGALLLVLASKSKKNFCNSGDVVVWSAVQLSGFFMCLLGAARITHRAQRVVAIASRWHMSLCSAASNAKATDVEAPPPPPRRPPPPPAQEEVEGAEASVEDDISDSDLSEECVAGTLSTLQGRASSYDARQALVLYLQHNGGGITLFGFALDRGFVHTLFAFETTMVLWILSKVVVLS